MSHDAVTCGFARQQSASHDPSSTEIVNFGHLSPFMEGTGWTGDLVAAPGNNREGVNKWCAQTSDPLQARAVGQPKLRAQRLKALHGWLTCGSMMSGKPCRSPGTRASWQAEVNTATASGPKPRLRSTRPRRTATRRRTRPRWRLSRRVG